MNINEVYKMIEEEKNLYIPTNYRFLKSIHHKRYMIWQYLKCFRLAQYWQSEINKSTVTVLHKLYARFAYRYYLRKKNILGEKTSIEIANHCILGHRINIWHGNDVINANLGDDCIIHGNNVLGNNGQNPSEVPSLGKGVDVGVGAVVIGNIQIADKCKIGANAVVRKSFVKPGSIIVGIPAELKER